MAKNTVFRGTYPPQRLPFLISTGAEKTAEWARISSQEDASSVPASADYSDFAGPGGAWLPIHAGYDIPGPRQADFRSWRVTSGKLSRPDCWTDLPAQQLRSAWLGQLTPRRKQDWQFQGCRRQRSPQAQTYASNTPKMDWPRTVLCRAAPCKPHPKVKLRLLCIMDAFTSK